MPLDWLILLQDSWPWPEGSNEWGLCVLLFRRFLEIGSLLFSATLHGVRGPCNVVYDRARFFENHVFCPKNEENIASPVFFEKVQLFFSILFFINLVYNKSLCCCNSSMLEQISYWFSKFWFLRYDPKSSWPIRLRDFSINRKTLKLALSHKEINEINCFLVFGESIQQFSQEWLISFSWFLAQWQIIRILENWQNPFLPGKFIFGPNFGKKCPEWAQNRVFQIFWRILSC